MRINIARQGSALWQECVDLARVRYERDYGADIAPSPDCFIALCADGPGEPVALACAGLTYGGSRDLLIENYLGEEPAEVLARRFGEPCEPTDLVEVGPLASSESGAGLALIRMLPALGWCNGAQFLMCTVTRSLARTLARIDIEFTAMAAAREDLLPPSQQGRWGTYYDTEPAAGYIDLRGFDAQFSRSGEVGYHLAVTWGQEIAPLNEGAAA
ncbi:thermostable hemolysin [Streptacidiphilus sp. EB129]|uniref:thermostable hemolysin n=1 Tax=Streptacidiphilus sp. EB129 TaxID=3156262 RepID=UPI0035157754